MNYSKNRRDLSAISDCYEMREQAKQDYHKRMQELEENSMYSAEYKMELAGKAKQELDSKIAGLNSTMTSTMQSLFDRAYDTKIKPDSDLTNLLTFLRASGNALDKEQVRELSEPYRGRMSVLKLIESVAESSGIKNVDLVFEDSFYFHKKNKQPDGSVPDGHTEQEFLEEWQESVTNDDFVGFSQGFEKVCSVLGEDLTNPVTSSGYEMPTVM